MKKGITIAVIVLFSLTGFSQDLPEQPETMPLIPMMQLLLTDMQKVDRGILTEDYAAIAEGAKAIAEHPIMTEEDKKLVKETLGQEIKQFVEFDMTVHHHADTMQLAALERDMQQVLNHYRIVQQACVDCHSNYRESISKARKQK